MQNMTEELAAIVFDLDGTLIDSSASILAGFSAALTGEGITSAVPLTPEIIGPPLKATLSILANSLDETLLDRLADRFKTFYDTTGYRDTAVFPGIPDMLCGIVASGIPMHIATNKRLLPTQRILEHLGWHDLFGRVATLDTWSPPANDKSEMIHRLLAELALVPSACLYVGDRREDAVAASANGMRFAFAAWGYGTPAGDAIGSPFSHPSGLLAQIA